ncbi:MAG: hypothetical protein R3A45_09375 [Bdellovibrionota bacterium]
MGGLETDSWKYIMIVLSLELLFLTFAMVFVGHGLKQWHKHTQLQHLFTACTGLVMAGISLYATFLLLN